MSISKKSILCLVVSLACCSLFNGCSSKKQPTQALGNQPKDHAGADTLTPQIARDALLEMIAHQHDEWLSGQADRVRNSAIDKKASGDSFKIGSFVCDPQSCSFQLFLWGKGVDLIYEGTFQRTNDGSWNARVTGVGESWKEEID